MPKQPPKILEVGINFKPQIKMKQLIFASAACILLLFSASTTDASYGTLNNAGEYFGQGCKVYSEDGSALLAECNRCNCAKLIKTVRQYE